MNNEETKPTEENGTPVESNVPTAEEVKPEQDVDDTDLDLDDDSDDEDEDDDE